MDSFIVHLSVIYIYIFYLYKVFQQLYYSHTSLVSDIYIYTVQMCNRTLLHYGIRTVLLPSYNIKYNK